VYVLDCDHLQLPTFPTNIPINTQKIKFGGNAIVEFGNNNSFEYLLPDLHTIYLNNNLIATINDTAFQFTPNLKIILLHYNFIPTISSVTFANLSKLQYLYIYQNSITSIGAGAFNDLTSLEYLQMENNQISFFPDQLFAPLTSLQLMYSYGNSNPDTTCCQACGLNSNMKLRMDDTSNATTLSCGCGSTSACAADTSCFSSQCTTLTFYVSAAVSSTQARGRAMAALTVATATVVWMAGTGAGWM